eukprot:sb/3464482/
MSSASSPHSTTKPCLPSQISSPTIPSRAGSSLRNLSETTVKLQLKYLLDSTSLNDIIFQKSLLDFHYIVVVNWKVFEHEVMKKRKLWGSCRAYSSFNRDVLHQGYQKIKFQGSKSSQKVLVYLKNSASYDQSHIPCFIPVSEVHEKQRSLKKIYSKDFFISSKRKKKTGSRTKKLGRKSALRKLAKTPTNHSQPLHSDIDTTKITSMFLANLLDNHIYDTLYSVVCEGLDELEPDDTLVWDPNRLSEEDTKWFLKQWSFLKSNINCSSQSSHAIEHIPDIEEALKSLASHNYHISDTLCNLKSELASSSRGCGDNPAGSAKVDNGNFLKGMTDQMKMKFERGLVKFGENMDQIHKYYTCLQNLRPLDLDLYLYSDERQHFISHIEVSRKIVTLLDSASYHHMSKIEFFEVDKDWAKMRQVILEAENSNILSTQTRGQSSKSLRQKRSRRLPRRYMNYRVL